VDETPEINYVDELAAKLGESWPAIIASRNACNDEAMRLRGFVGEIQPPSDTSVVAFGSLARGEWTDGSDVDWTLIIDGQSDVEHFNIAIEIEKSFAEASTKKPGETGTFGSIVGSHELVHQIGGTEDTNQNMSRRVLLLLESVSLSDSLAHERVIRAVLRRYIESDLPASGTTKFHVPMFLLNDVVRFWRTLAVDYASKKRRRANQGWALRNIKLRMSRILLFAKGMLACFLCDDKLGRKLPLRDEATEIEEIALLERCYCLMRIPALELLAWALSNFATSETSRSTMDAYNRFLVMLSDGEQRDHLNSLKFEDRDDSVFIEQRENSNVFQEGLKTLFFESDRELTTLTQKNGVF
jgi:predicted nucleotidyltransferase